MVPASVFPWSVFGRRRSQIRRSLGECPRPRSRSSQPARNLPAREWHSCRSSRRSSARPVLSNTRESTCGFEKPVLKGLQCNPHPCFGDLPRGPSPCRPRRNRADRRRSARDRGRRYRGPVPGRVQAQEDRAGGAREDPRRVARVDGEAETCGNPSSPRSLMLQVQPASVRPKSGSGPTKSVSELSTPA